VELPGESRHLVIWKRSLQGASKNSIVLSNRRFVLKNYEKKEDLLGELECVVKRLQSHIQPDIVILFAG